MTAMRPAPNHTRERLESEAAVLDEVIERIEQSLPIIHRKVAESETSDAPSSRLSHSEFQRAQRVFQDMSEDSLLTDDGEDIRLKDKRPKKVTGAHKGKLNQINGKHP